MVSVFDVDLLGALAKVCLPVDRSPREPLRVRLARFRIQAPPPFVVPPVASERFA